MKKALKLAFIYLIVLITGTVIGTLLYSLYLNLLSFVAGNEITFFTDDELFRSLFYVMFCMELFILPLVSYYRSRHPGGLLQLIVYLMLCIITWGLLVPGSFKLKDFCTSRFSITNTREPLSPNYFRKVDDDVYYFTTDFNQTIQGRIPEAPAIVIDTSENGDVAFKTVGDFPEMALNKKALPFREVQLKKIFGEDENPVPIDFWLLNSMISGAYYGGLAHLLTMLSFIFLLCSVYGITNIFDWRLLNTVILFITTALILCLNSVYFLPQFDSLKARIMDNGFFRLLAGIVSEPILVIINLLFTLILIVTGIVKFAVRKHAKKAR